MDQLKSRNQKIEKERNRRDSPLRFPAEIYAGEKNLIGEGGLDLIMTGVGFIGPYGWAISSGYFLIKLTLENTGNDFWNK